MKQIRLFLALICLVAFIPLNAQKIFTGQVELLELDETTATFRAEGFAGKKKEVLEAAKMTVFHKLFYEGVEGFNEDRKLVEYENKYWLENFFKGDRAPYNGFVKGAQLEGETDQLATGEYHGFANVVVNYETLIRTLEINKIILDKNAPQKEDTPKTKRKFGIGVRNKTSE